MHILTDLSSFSWKLNILPPKAAQQPSLITIIFQHIIPTTQPVWKISKYLYINYQLLHIFKIQINISTRIS